MREENQNVKQEINEKKDVETQLKDLKLEIAPMVQEKLDALEDRLTN